MAMNNLNNRVTAVEALLARDFQNRDVLLEALLAPGCGVVMAGSRNVLHGNKTLAMLGDAVMRQLIVQEYYQNGAAPGVIQDNVSRIVNNTNLRDRGATLNLGAHIVTNPSQQGVVSPRVMQNTVEAIIGAAFLDGGKDAARQAMAVLGLV